MGQATLVQRSGAQLLCKIAVSVPVPATDPELIQVWSTRVEQQLNIVWLVFKLQFLHACVNIYIYIYIKILQLGLAKMKLQIARKPYRTDH